jgi:hypothetical protein
LKSEASHVHSKPNLRIGTVGSLAWVFGLGGDPQAHSADCHWELLSVFVDIVESEDGEKDRLSIDTHESVNQLPLTSEVMIHECELQDVLRQ